jgi:hypothetical protein
MNVCYEHCAPAPQKITFSTLAEQVLSLDGAIEWVALEVAGRGPHWAWREPDTGRLCSGSTTSDYEVVDPLLLVLADHPCYLGSEGVTDDPHRVRFIVLAYTNTMQIVARLAPKAHVVVALSSGIDPYRLGRKLVNLLDRATHRAGLH